MNDASVFVPQHMHDTNKPLFSRSNFNQIALSNSTLNNSWPLIGEPFGNAIFAVFPVLIVRLPFYYFVFRSHRIISRIFSEIYRMDNRCFLSVFYLTLTLLVIFLPYH